MKRSSYATVYETFWVPQQKYFDRVLSTDQAIGSLHQVLYPRRMAFPGRFAGSLLEMPDWNLDASDTGVLISFFFSKKGPLRGYGEMKTYVE